MSADGDGAARTLADLTPRQREVALLVAEGLTRKEAAARLGLAEQTVGNHISAVHRRTGIGTMNGIAAWVAAQTERQAAYRRAKDRVWSMEAHYCRGVRYVPLASVTAILKDVLG